jgi:hypothetical protein
MGLFDTIYVSGDVLAAWRFECRACGRVPPTDHDWQTKSLQPCMCSYYLRHDDGGAVRLYLLDRPSSRRFWRPWTAEEIAESERSAGRGPLPALLRKKAGEGCFLPEAFLPENRRQRFMGELPHQWVALCGRCECGEWAEHWIKFSDGVGVERRSERPRQESDFLDDASELGFE